MCMFCRWLFVFLYFSFWPLCCLSSDLRILITPLVSSSSSERHAITRILLKMALNTHYRITENLLKFIILTFPFVMKATQTFFTYLTRMFIWMLHLKIFVNWSTLNKLTNKCKEGYNNLHYQQSDCFTLN